LDGEANLQAAPFDGIVEFLATRDGLALAKAFVRIAKKGVRRQIVGLVEDLASHSAEAIKATRAPSAGSHF